MKMDEKIKVILEKNIRIVRKELETYRVPAYKIVWRRFKEFIA